MAKKILLLCFIFLLVFGIITPAVGYTVITSNVEVPTEDRGGIFCRVGSEVVEAFIGMFEAVTGEGLDELVFMRGVDRTYLPWHNAEQRAQILQWFYFLTAAIAPFFIFPILKTAFRLVLKSGNPQDRAEAMDSILRWFIAVLMIALAPMVMFTILAIAVYMVDAIVWAFARTAGLCLDEGLASLEVAGDLITGNIFTTSIVRLAFILFTAYLSILYLLRLLSLTIHLAFTPFVAIMYAIKKDITAVGIWFGEIASAAFMPVSHALVICTILLLAPGVGWFMTLIFLYSVIPLSEVLRNSMMNIFDRAAGWDEAGSAGKVMGAVTGVAMLSGVAKVAGASFGGGAKAGEANINNAKTERLDPKTVNAVMPNRSSAPSGVEPSRTTGANSSAETVSASSGAGNTPTGKSTEHELATVSDQPQLLEPHTRTQAETQRETSSPEGTIKQTDLRVPPSDRALKYRRYAATGVGYAIGGMAALIGGVVPGGEKLAGMAGMGAGRGAGYAIGRGTTLAYTMLTPNEKHLTLQDRDLTRKAEIEQQAEAGAKQRAEKQAIYRQVQNKQPMSEKDYRSILHTQANIITEEKRAQGIKLPNEEWMEKRAYNEVDAIIHKKKSANQSFPSANEVYQREKEGFNEFTISGTRSVFARHRYGKGKDTMD